MPRVLDTDALGFDEPPRIMKPSRRSASSWPAGPPPPAPPRAGKAISWLAALEPGTACLASYFTLSGRLFLINASGSNTVNRLAFALAPEAASIELPLKTHAAVSNHYVISTGLL